MPSPLPTPSPFHPLSSGQQVADTITQCTHIMISLEQLASDPANEAVLEDLFNNAAKAYNSGQEIGTIGSTTVTNAVETVTATATSMKNTWEAEALTAESLAIAVSAAQLVTAVFSWAPGVNLCVDLAAIAAYAAEQFAEHAAESEQSDLISYIANMNNEVLSQPGMNALQAWNSAIQKNILNFKKLALSATDQEIQATLMAMTDYLIEEGKELTVANYGDVIYQVASTIANNPGIDTAWRNAMCAIEANPVPEELNRQAQLLNADFPKAFTGTSNAMFIYTGLMTTIDSARFGFLRYVFKQEFRFQTYLPDFDPEGAKTTAANAAMKDPKVVMLRKVGTGIRCLGMIGNVAFGVFSILGIINTVNAASQISDAISQAHDGMHDYYLGLSNAESAQQAVENK